MARKSKGKPARGGNARRTPAPKRTQRAARARGSDQSAGIGASLAGASGAAASGFATLIALPFRSRRSTEWAITTLLIGALVCGWILAKPRLLDRVAGTHADPIAVHIDVPADPNNPGNIAPAIPGRIVEWLTNLVNERATNHAFHTDDLENARQAILSTGWLKNDLTLQRQPKGVIHVRGTWRRPAAIVHDAQDRYLVANDSAPLMLPTGFPIPNTAYIIHNPTMPPPRREAPPDHSWRVQIAYGEPWPGEDVKAAIELLGILDRSPVRAQVMGIDLAAFPADGHLTIITDSNSRIVWGSPSNPDGTAPPGEQPITERLRRLESFLSTHRRIDAGHDHLLIYTPTVMTPPTGPRTARP
ncbi:MAG: cell division protein FtsQ/DivIB [Phycisphaerales bacterium]